MGADAVVIGAIVSVAITILVIGVIAYNVLKHMDKDDKTDK